MKTAGDRIFALALGAAALGLAGAPLRAEPAVTLKPLAAASIDAGPKHMVGYFIGSGGACRLTLMIADAASLEQATPATATTRLVAPIDSGKSAQIDTAVGQTLRFACASDGQAMTVTAIDRNRRVVD
ncbi:MULTISPECIES: hypothetical protein [Methylosinus]|uniref:Uncharacterized protein n=1 Tax=Methylosinus trichosporium (strain ATCC 35070 / NCIMB 11131 / UNIQEM 75 / OB3b) TaxID=595536 RepID=A0A2D2D5F5_METT3|nr:MULTISPECIES: hypothetical protein [Methylosinus]ATQ70196.1 hypothetical protein CQW49_02840 [Methylosinus trichosporium OB3b]OBS54166.1 hypothetical protein A8B73_02300 [Methylosinus sp. 3S-1]